MKRDIEGQIASRSYQSPGRARAAISRSRLSPRKKERLLEAVNAWENEGASEPPVIGALPPASAEPLGSEIVPRHQPAHLPSPRLVEMLPEPMTVNLNARVRAQLTPYGVSLLYQSRSKVAVPEDLLEKQGVWTTELWEFMAAFGPHLSLGLGEVPTVLNSIEILTR
jgi:hypothetical protein